MLVSLKPQTVNGSSSNPKSLRSAKVWGSWGTAAADTVILLGALGAELDEPWCFSFPPSSPWNHRKIILKGASCLCNPFAY